LVKKGIIPNLFSIFDLRIPNTTKMINLSFNPSQNRLEVHYSDVIILDEIIDYIETVKNDLSLPRKLKILTFARGSSMDFGHEDLPKIVQAVEKSLKNYELMLDAFVVDKSKETAFSLLFSNLSERKDYRFNVFSTTEAAEKWLKQFNF
jgi:hypothetical protein